MVDIEGLLEAGVGLGELIAFAVEDAEVGKDVSLEALVVECPGLFECLSEGDGGGVEVVTFDEDAGQFEVDFCTQRGVLGRFRKGQRLTIPLLRFIGAAEGADEQATMEQETRPLLRKAFGLREGFSAS